MDCEEFLRQFRDALDGKVSESVIQDNVRYYRSYINSQTASGKSEPDVLRMLGDPRLLAKTIEESCKFASGKENRADNAGGYHNGSFSNMNYGNYSSAGSANREYTDTKDDRRGGIPGWLVMGIVVVVVILVLSILFHVFVILLPYILVFLLAGFLVRAVYNWRQRK